MQEKIVSQVKVSKLIAYFYVSKGNWSLFGMKKTIIQKNLW